MQKEGGGNVVLDECDCGLFVEDEIGQQEQGADGQGHVGIDDDFGGPELTGEDLGEGGVRVKCGSAGRG